MKIISYENRKVEIIFSVLWPILHLYTGSQTQIPPNFTISAIIEFELLPLHNLIKQHWNNHHRVWPCSSSDLVLQNLRLNSIISLSLVQWLKCKCSGLLSTFLTVDYMHTHSKAIKLASDLPLLTTAKRRQNPLKWFRTTEIKFQREIVILPPLYQQHPQVYNVETGTTHLEDKHIKDIIDENTESFGMVLMGSTQLSLWVWHWLSHHLDSRHLNCRRAPNSTASGGSLACASFRIMYHGIQGPAED